MAGGGIKINNIKVSGGADGVSFVPSYDNESGVLSWEAQRNGQPVNGYTAPAPAVIKGKDGKDGQKGQDGAKLVSQVFYGKDAQGGNIYKQTFSDGTEAYFTAPKGDAGSGSGVYGDTKIEFKEEGVVVEDLTGYYGQTTYFDGKIIYEDDQTQYEYYFPTQSGGLLLDTMRPTSTRAGAVKIDDGAFKQFVVDSNGFLTLYPAPTGAIDSRAGDMPITISNVDHAVISVMTEYNRTVLTEEQQATACEWLGVDDKIDSIRTLEGYRLIEDITLAEDVLKITINNDNSGNPLNLKSIFVFFFGEYASTASSGNAFTLSVNNGLIYGMYHFVGATGDKKCVYWVDFKREKSLPLENHYLWLSKFPTKPLVGVNNNNRLQGLSDANVALISDTAFSVYKNATELSFGTAGNNAVKMKAGSRIIIWGLDDD